MNEKIKTIFTILFLLLCTCLVSGCADSVSFEQAGAMKAVGFWHGLWHGTISVIALIVSLFNDNVAIYAIYNNGGWYDFGFILGIGAIGGGVSESSK
jgi:hypothetical protein